MDEKGRVLAKYAFHGPLEILDPLNSGTGQGPNSQPSFAPVQIRERLNLGPRFVSTLISVALIQVPIVLPLLFSFPSSSSPITNGFYGSAHLR
jgi:hypothetical protein